MSEQRIQFGTDGIRARVGDWPLTPRGLHTIGQALAGWLFAEHGQARVVLGRDTRQSGPELQAALTDGLLAGGAEVLDGGVLPTAAVSTAIVATGATGGVVLTASHNPWFDNGVKVLAHTGGKLSPSSGLAAFFDQAPQRAGGRVESLTDPAESWRAAMPAVDLSGLRILLDAAHGAASSHAPGVLRERGAEVVGFACSPDGQNINDGVGATHPPSASAVASAGCDLAVCLDGDADRLMLVDAHHGLLDGDDILWLLTAQSTDPVVGTIMSNGGLEAALGGRLLRTPVGDRHVAQAMVSAGARVGAEPSGHVLFSDGLPTGDGLYSALRVLAAHPPSQRGTQPGALPCGGWTRWPQAKVNLRFTGTRRPLDQLTTPSLAREAGQRVIVRYSGTEPVLRIMVEGLGQGQASPAAWAARISEEFRS